MTHKWPKQEELDAVLKYFEENPGIGGRVITNDYPLVDRIKRDICAQFIIYKREHEITQREFAQKLGIGEALVSKILRYHFDEFTIDRLIRYLEILKIKFEFRRIA
jgi:predicted XRE-type DNA-binding protein